MRYDVLIVGGGPAGAVAAINLIGSGLRVAILDRARFPRLKPCGGGISRRAYRRFDYIAPVMRSVPTNFVTRLRFQAPSGDAVEFGAGEPLYAMIRRIEFDNALLNHCKQGGIEVREEVTVSKVEVRSDGVRLTSTDGEEFEAELAIGADGVNSTVAIQAGLRGPWPASRLGIDGAEESPMTGIFARQDTMYVYYGVGGMYGYGYVFPKATHVNFGLGYLVADFKVRAKERPYDLHLRFLDRLRQAGVVQGDSQRENFHAYAMPLGGPIEHVSRDRVLLAGDAGGFVNGFTAEGIYYAMVSGEHAGRTALEAIRKRDASAAFLSRHDRACSAELGAELRESVALQRRLFANPRLIDSVVRFAARSQTARTLLAQFGIGELSYSQVKKRAFFQAFPAYLRYRTDKLLHLQSSGHRAGV